MNVVVVFVVSAFSMRPFMCTILYMKIELQTNTMETICFRIFFQIDWFQSSFVFIGIGNVLVVLMLFHRLIDFYFIFAIKSTFGKQRANNTIELVKINR